MNLLKFGGDFMYVILVYDISGDEGGKKVLPNVFKTCKKYLTHIQNSVFEGELSEGQILKLNRELKKYIRKDIDSVILFKSRNERWLQKEFWAKKDDAMDNFI
jgi:CRISPR-associated protein Cas2